NDTVNRSQSAPRLFEDFLELAGMPDLSHWTAFLGAAFILLITPGPSIMYVVARGIAQGFRALSSVGLALGDLLQVIATAVGLSALLGSAPKLFAAVKLVGALYLVCLGAATLLGKGGRVANSATEQGSRQADSSKWLIIQGFLALNPKTALFFLAFLPQFIAADGTGANSSAVIWDGIRCDGLCHELIVRLSRRDARSADWERGKAPDGDAVCRW